MRQETPISLLKSAGSHSAGLNARTFGAVRRSSATLIRWRSKKQETPSQAALGRGYKVDEFDILAACLFNQTGEWKYLFLCQYQP